MRIASKIGFWVIMTVFSITVFPIVPTWAKTVVGKEFSIPKGISRITFD